MNPSTNRTAAAAAAYRNPDVAAAGVTLDGVIRTTKLLVGVIHTSPTRCPYHATLAASCLMPLGMLLAAESGGARRRSFGGGGSCDIFGPG